MHSQSASQPASPVAQSDASSPIHSLTRLPSGDPRLALGLSATITRCIVNYLPTYLPIREVKQGKARKIDRLE